MTWTIAVVTARVTSGYVTYKNGRHCCEISHPKVFDDVSDS